MAKIAAIPYRTYDHGSFDDEWGCHQKVSEWNDRPGRIRSGLPDRTMAWEVQPCAL